MIIFTVLDTVATVDVLTASNNDVSFVETQTVHSAWPLNRRFVLSWKNRQSRPRFPALASFACPPEIHRDIAFILSILKRVKKMLGIVNEVYCVSGIGLSTLEIWVDFWNQGFLLHVLLQGAHTMCVCNQSLFCSKWTGFPVCITYNDISLSMYINRC